MTVECRTKPRPHGGGTRHSWSSPQEGPGDGPSSTRRPRPAPARSRPASYPSPTGPVLRANPCPEVTDLICRLPLPTLFYRLEAVYLGDLLRIWVRSGMKITLSPQDFHGPTGVHRTPREARCFTGTNVPISGQAPSREYDPYKEKRTLPGTPVSVSWFVCVAALDPEGPISIARFGNINPIPFR